MNTNEMNDEIFELTDEALEGVVGGRSLYDSLNTIERRKWVALNNAAVSAANTSGIDSSAYKVAQRNLDTFREDMLEKYGQSMGIAF